MIEVHDDDKLWSYGNLTARTQERTAAIAREISNAMQSSAY